MVVGSELRRWERGESGEYKADFDTESELTTTSPLLCCTTSYLYL